MTSKRYQFGITQITLLLGLLLVAVAIPVSITLVSQNQENRSDAAKGEKSAYDIKKEKEEAAKSAKKAKDAADKAAENPDNQAALKKAQDAAKQAADDQAKVDKSVAIATIAKTTIVQIVSLHDEDCKIAGANNNGIRDESCYASAGVCICGGREVAGTIAPVSKSTLAPVFIPESSKPTSSKTDEIPISENTDPDYFDSDLKCSTAHPNEKYCYASAGGCICGEIGAAVKFTYGWNSKQQKITDDLQNGDKSGLIDVCKQKQGSDCDSLSIESLISTYAPYFSKDANVLAQKYNEIAIQVSIANDVSSGNKDSLVALCKQKQSSGCDSMSLENLTKTFLPNFDSNKIITSFNNINNQKPVVEALFSGDKSKLIDLCLKSGSSNTDCNNSSLASLINKYLPQYSGQTSQIVSNYEKLISQNQVALEFLNSSDEELRKKYCPSVASNEYCLKTLADIKAGLDLKSSGIGDSQIKALVSQKNAVEYQNKIVSEYLSKTNEQLVKEKCVGMSPDNCQKLISGGALLKNAGVSEEKVKQIIASKENTLNKYLSGQLTVTTNVDYQTEYDKALKDCSGPTRKCEIDADFVAKKVIANATNEAKTQKSKIEAEYRSLNLPTPSIANYNTEYQKAKDACKGSYSCLQLIATVASKAVESSKLLAQKIIEETVAIVSACKIQGGENCNNLDNSLASIAKLTGDNSITLESIKSKKIESDIQNNLYSKNIGVVNSLGINPNTVTDWVEMDKNIASLRTNLSVNTVLTWNEVTSGRFKRGNDTLMSQFKNCTGSSINSCEIVENYNGSTVFNGMLAQGGDAAMLAVGVAAAVPLVLPAAGSLGVGAAVAGSGGALLGTGLGVAMSAQMAGMAGDVCQMVKDGNPSVAQSDCDNSRNMAVITAVSIPLGLAKGAVQAATAGRAINEISTAMKISKTAITATEIATETLGYTTFNSMAEKTCADPATSEVSCAISKGMALSSGLKVLGSIGGVVGQTVQVIKPLDTLRAANATSLNTWGKYVETAASSVHAGSAISFGVEACLKLVDPANRNLDTVSMCGFGINGAYNSGKGFVDTYNKNTALVLPPEANKSTISVNEKVVTLEDKLSLAKANLAIAEKKVAEWNSKALPNDTNLPESIKSSLLKAQAEVDVISKNITNESSPKTEVVAENNLQSAKDILTALEKQKTSDIEAGKGISQEILTKIEQAQRNIDQIVVNNPPVESQKTLDVPAVVPKNSGLSLFLENLGIVSKPKASVEVLNTQLVMKSTKSAASAPSVEQSVKAKLDPNLTQKERVTEINNQTKTQQKKLNSIDTGETFFEKIIGKKNIDNPQYISEQNKLLKLQKQLNQEKLLLDLNNQLSKSSKDPVKSQQLTDAISRIEKISEIKIETGDPKLDSIYENIIRNHENTMQSLGRAGNNGLFSIDASQTKAFLEIMSSPELVKEFALAGGKTSVIGPMVMKAGERLYGRTGQFIAAEGQAKQAFADMAEALTGQKGKNLKNITDVVLFDDAKQVLTLQDKLLNAKHIVTDVQTIGFLDTMILEGNSPKAQLQAARKVLSKLRTNTQVFADEAHLNFDPNKNFVMSNGQKTPLDNWVKVATNNIKEIFIDFNVLKSGQDANLTSPILKLEMVDGKKSVQISDTGKIEVAKKVAAKLGLSEQSVIEIFKDPISARDGKLAGIENISKQQLGEVLNHVEVLIEFGNKVSMDRGDSFAARDGASNGSKTSAVIAKDGNAQPDQQISHQVQAAVFETVASTALGKTPNLDAISLTSKSAKATFANHIEAIRDNKNSALSAGTGTVGRNKGTLETAYRLAVTTTDVILKKFLGTVGNEGIIKQENIRGLGQIDGTPISKQKIIEQSIEQSVAIKNKTNGNKNTAEIVLGGRDIAPDVWAENAAKNKNYTKGEEHVFIIRDENGIWKKMIAVDGKITNTKIIEYIEAKTILDNQNTKNTTVVIGEGGSTGTDVQALDSVAGVDIISTQNGRDQLDQSVARIGRKRGTNQEYNLLIIGENLGREVPKSELRAKFNQVQEVQNKQNTYEAVSSAVDKASTDVLVKIITQGQEGSIAVIEARKLLVEIQNPKEGRNFSYEKGVQDPLTALKSKIEAINQIYSEVKPGGKYEKFYNSVKNNNEIMSDVQANKSGSGLEFAKSGEIIASVGNEGVFGARNMESLKNRFKETISSDLFPEKVSGGTPEQKVTELNTQNVANQSNTIKEPLSSGLSENQVSPSLIVPIPQAPIVQNPLQKLISSITNLFNNVNKTQTPPTIVLSDPIKNAYNQAVLNATNKHINVSGLKTADEINIRIKTVESARVQSQTVSKINSFGPVNAQNYQSALKLITEAKNNGVNQEIVDNFSEKILRGLPNISGGDGTNDIESVANMFINLFDNPQDRLSAKLISSNIGNNNVVVWRKVFDSLKNFTNKTSFKSLDRNNRDGQIIELLTNQLTPLGVIDGAAQALANNYFELNKNSLLSKSNSDFAKSVGVVLFPGDSQELWTNQLNILQKYQNNGEQWDANASHSYYDIQSIIYNKYLSLAANAKKSGNTSDYDLNLRKANDMVPTMRLGYWSDVSNSVATILYGDKIADGTFGTVYKDPNTNVLTKLFKRPSSSSLDSQVKASGRSKEDVLQTMLTSNRQQLEFYDKNQNIHPFITYKGRVGGGFQQQFFENTQSLAEYLNSGEVVTDDMAADFINQIQEIQKLTGEAHGDLYNLAEVEGKYKSTFGLHPTNIMVQKQSDGTHKLIAIDFAGNTSMAPNSDLKSPQFKSEEISVIQNSFSKLVNSGISYNIKFLANLGVPIPETGDVNILASQVKAELKELLKSGSRQPNETFEQLKNRLNPLTRQSEELKQAADVKLAQAESERLAAIAAEKEAITKANQQKKAMVSNSLLSGPFAEAQKNFNVAPKKPWGDGLLEENYQRLRTEILAKAGDTNKIEQESDKIYQQLKNTPIVTMKDSLGALSVVRGQPLLSAYRLAGNKNDSTGHTTQNDIDMGLNNFIFGRWGQQAGFDPNRYGTYAVIVDSSNLLLPTTVVTLDDRANTKSNEEYQQNALTGDRYLRLISYMAALENMTANQVSSNSDLNIRSNLSKWLSRAEVKILDRVNSPNIKFIITNNHQNKEALELESTSEMEIYSWEDLLEEYSPSIDPDKYKLALLKLSNGDRSVLKPGVTNRYESLNKQSDKLGVKRKTGETNKQLSDRLATVAAEKEAIAKANELALAKKAQNEADVAKAIEVQKAQQLNIGNQITNFYNGATGYLDLARQVISTLGFARISEWSSELNRLIIDRKQRAIYYQSSVIYPKIQDNLVEIDLPPRILTDLEFPIIYFTSLKNKYLEKILILNFSSELTKTQIESINKLGFYADASNPNSYKLSDQEVKNVKFTTLNKEINSILKKANTIINKVNFEENKNKIYILENNPDWTITPLTKQGINVSYLLTRKSTNESYVIKQLSEKTKDVQNYAIIPDEVKQSGRIAPIDYVSPEGTYLLKKYINGSEGQKLLDYPDYVDEAYVLLKYFVENGLNLDDVFIVNATNFIYDNSKEPGHKLVVVDHGSIFGNGQIQTLENQKNLLEYHLHFELKDLQHLMRMSDFKENIPMFVKKLHILHSLYQKSQQTGLSEYIFPSHEILKRGTPVKTSIDFNSFAKLFIDFASNIGLEQNVVLNLSKLSNSLPSASEESSQDISVAKKELERKLSLIISNQIAQKTLIINTILKSVTSNDQIPIILNLVNNKLIYLQYIKSRDFTNIIIETTKVSIDNSLSEDQTNYISSLLYDYIHQLSFSLKDPAINFGIFDNDIRNDNLKNQLTKNKSDFVNLFINNLVIDLQKKPSFQAEKNITPIVQEVLGYLYDEYRRILNITNTSNFSSTKSPSDIDPVEQFVVVESGSLVFENTQKNKETIREKIFVENEYPKVLVSKPSAQEIEAKEKADAITTINNALENPVAPEQSATDISNSNKDISLQGYEVKEISLTELRTMFTSSKSGFRVDLENPNRLRANLIIKHNDRFTTNNGKTPVISEWDLFDSDADNSTPNQTTFMSHNLIDQWIKINKKNPDFQLILYFTHDRTTGTTKIYQYTKQEIDISSNNQKSKDLVDLENESTISSLDERIRQIRSFDDVVDIQGGSRTVVKGLYSIIRENREYFEKYFMNATGKSIDEYVVLEINSSINKNIYSRQTISDSIKLLQNLPPAEKLIVIIQHGVASSVAERLKSNFDYDSNNEILSNILWKLPRKITANYVDPILNNMSKYKPRTQEEILENNESKLKFTKELISKHGGVGTVVEKLLDIGYRADNQGFMYPPTNTPKEKPYTAQVQDNQGKMQTIPLEYKLHVSSSTKDFDVIVSEISKFLLEQKIAHKIWPGKDVTVPGETVQLGKVITIYTTQTSTMQKIVTKAVELGNRYSGITPEELSKADASLKYELSVPGTNNILYYTVDKVDGKDLNTLSAKIILPDGTELKGYSGRETYMKKYWGSGPLDSLWTKNPLVDDSTPLTFTNTPQSGQINAWNNSEGINFFYDTGVKIIDFFKNLFQKPTNPVSNPITPQETNIMKPVEELLLSYGDNSVKVIGISLNNVKLSTRTEIILKNGYLVTINSSLNYSSSTPLTLVITNPNGQEVTTATFKSLGGFNGDTNLIDSSGKIIALARGRNIPMAIAQSLTGLQEIEINNSFVDSSRFNSWVEQQTSTLDFTNTPQSGQINAWNNSEGINFFYNLFFKTKVTTQVATEILNISDITNSNCWGSSFISPVYAVGSANGNGCNIKNFNLNQAWQTFSSPEFSTAIKKVWSVSDSKASAGVNLAQITLAQLFPQIPPCTSEYIEKYQRHRNIVGVINRVGLSIIAQQDHIDLPVEIPLNDNCKDTTMQNLPIIPPNPPIILPDSYSAQYLNNFIATNFDTLPIISEEVYQLYLNKSCPVKDSSYSLGSWRINDQRCSIACTKSGESQGSCSNIKVVPSNEIICKDNSVIEASTNKLIENCSSCINGACIINVSAGKSIPCSVPNKINPSSSSGQSFVFCNPQTKTWQPYAQGTEIEFTNSCPNIYRELLLADMISVQNNLIAKTGKLNISCNERGSDDDIFKEGTLNYNTTLSGIYNFSNLILTCDPTSLAAGGKKACVRPEVDGTNVLVHELSHMWVESLWQEGYNVTEAFSEVTGCKSDGSGTTVFKPGMAPVKQWGLQNCNEALATEFDTYTDPKESCKMKQNRPQEYLWLNTSELSPFKDSWNCGKI